MALVAAVRRLAHARLREYSLRTPAVASSAWATGQRSFNTGAQPVRSRLGCQICLSKSLEGMVARVPESVADIRQSKDESA
ncbi:hypothetical protein INR49_029360 [Caranx melampygus]|nr:hypothetical protein INR49_029360 [Caranx melampygus]